MSYVIITIIGLVEWVYLVKFNIDPWSANYWFINCLVLIAYLGGRLASDLKNK